MPSCAAYGCTNRPDRDRKRSVTFHKFPKGNDLRIKWIQAIRRSNFQPSKSAVLCSDHFTEADFDKTSLSCVRLKDGSVPSIFKAFPQHLKKTVKQRKPPIERSVNVPEEYPPSTSSAPDICTYNHPPDTVETPVKTALKRKLFESEKKVSASRKKIKLLLQSKRRLMKRNAELKSVISDLKKQDLLSSGSIDVLQTCAGGVSDLLKRKFSKDTNKALPVSYSPQLRSFALTLHFYSPRAYNYIRKMFDTCLPHPRTISKWYQSLDNTPGFTDTAFAALKCRADLGRANGKHTPVALMMDEVAIRQHVEWDGNKYQGYIDMGTELDDECLPLAKEALTFMVVCVNGSWKLPIGYFLIDGMSGLERKNLVNRCLEKLHAVGVTAVSLTLDGASSNIGMLKALGVKIENPTNVKSSFPHPVTGSPVYAFLDACHMLKLVRNTLADKGSLFSNSDIIKWEYIVSLNKLQQCEGLHLGNKLRAKHIDWHRKKMCVKLAAQVLSESVATSLDFCLKEDFPEFSKCEATVKFIRMFDKLFDILNSRNLKSFGWKSPVQDKNCTQITTFLSEAKSYILSLKESKSGVSIVHGNRKTGFLGFLLCIESVIGLYEMLVLSGQYGMKYLLTYKFSQDHLELFFGKIRSMGGCNNNPTARQFKSAYQKLLTYNDIQDVTRGNCLPLETVPILTASSSYVTNIDKEVPSLEVINSTVSRNRMIEPEDICVNNDHDYIFIESSTQLSVCTKKIVAYIAGFVVFRLKKSLCCEVCISALTNPNITPLHSLIAMKSKGALIYPSSDVINICVLCEKYFRRHVISGNEMNLSLSNVQCHKLVQSVLESYLNKPIFSSITYHMLDTEGCMNHIILLIKAVAEKYLQVRYFYAGKSYTANLKHNLKSKSRQVLNKLVLFSGQ